MAKRSLKIILGSISALVFAFFLHSHASAAEEASMYLSPSTGVHVVDQEFSVDIVLDTGGQNVNAAEAVLLYDPQELEVLGTSMEGSIFPSWVLEPNYNNSSGRIEFAGNSSSQFNGIEGKVVSVRFKALQEGITNVRFHSGAILAADGRGTNIVSKLISGVYTIDTEVDRVVPEPEYVPPRGAPRAVTITSPTHPDQEEWYQDNVAELRWSLPTDITAVRMVVDKKTYSIPSVYYGERVTERTLQNLDEGTWYFHLQTRNLYGWGEVSHYKIQVDTAKPDYFRIKELERDDPTNPVVSFIVDSFDSVSGIEKYEVTVNNKKEVWLENGNQIHTLGPFDPGSYSMTIRSVDTAGNYLVDTASFEIKPLEPPLIYEYPDVINSGSTAVIKGNTYANANVTVFMQKDNGRIEKYSTTSDNSGIFTFIPAPAPEDGIYDIWSTVEDQRGGKSSPSKKIRVSVRPPGVLMAAAYALDTVSIFVPLTAVLFLLSVLMAHFYHRYVALRQALKKEVAEAEMVVHGSFLTLKKEAHRNVKILEKAKGMRGLTREELAVMDGLKGNLQKIEDTVTKEMSDIEEVLGTTLDMRPGTPKKSKFINFVNYIKHIKNKVQKKRSA